MDESFLRRRFLFFFSFFFSFFAEFERSVSWPHVNGWICELWSEMSQGWPFSVYLFPAFYYYMKVIIDFLRKQILYNKFFITIKEKKTISIELIRTYFNNIFCNIWFSSKFIIKCIHYFCMYVVVMKFFLWL